MNFKYLLAVSALLAGTVMIPAASDAAQNRSSYNGLTIGTEPMIEPSVSRPLTDDVLTDKPNVYPRRGTVTDKPSVYRPLDDVQTTNNMEQLRLQRAQEEAAERQARIDRLNEMRDTYRAERADLLENRSAGTDNPGGMTEQERFTWNQDKMALLRAYKAKRGEEIEMMQQSYQQMNR